MPWPSSYAEGIEWGRIYAEDPDPDGDGVLKTGARVLNVFNAHWPVSGLDENREPFFCEESATITHRRVQTKYLKPAATTSYKLRGLRTRASRRAPT